MASKSTAGGRSEATGDRCGVLRGVAEGIAGQKPPEPVDSEDLSILSSDGEFEHNQDGKIIVLGNGISN